MQLFSRQFVFVWSGVFLVTFSILHYLYRFIPFLPFALISGTDESNVEHFKMGFYNLLILLPIELKVYKDQIKDRDSFIWATIFMAVFAPWIITLIWYMVPALYGPWPTIWGELLWALAGTYLTGLVIFTLQGQLTKLTYEKTFKMMIILLVVLAVVFFSVFTFKKPWADYFTPAY